MTPILAATVVGLLTTGAATAQTLECGTTYVVQRGDTLQRIATRAYGPEANYLTLWRANRERIAANDPSLIEIGETLFLPCLGPDGEPAPESAAAGGEATGASDPRRPSISQAEEGLALGDRPVASDPSEDRSVGAVSARGAEGAPPEAQGEPAMTASSVDVAPASESATEAPVETPAIEVDAPGPIGENPEIASEPAIASESPGDDASSEADRRPRIALSREAGTARAIVAEALAIGSGDKDFRIETVGENALSAADGVSVFAAPTTCDGREAATECAGFFWSSTLVDRLVVVHAPAAGPAPVTADDLSTLRLCVGEGVPDAALTRLGVAPDPALTRRDVTACFAALLSGAADVAISIAEQADASLPSTGGTLREISALSVATPIRAGAPIDDQEALATLAALEAGLAELRASGRWLEIVSAALMAPASP